jgi:hypothetical protein
MRKTLTLGVVLIAGVAMAHDPAAKFRAFRTQHFSITYGHYNPLCNPLCARPTILLCACSISSVTRSPYFIVMRGSA